MVSGCLLIYTYLVSFWTIILLAPPKSKNGAKIYRKCENYAALTTNSLLEIRNTLEIAIRSWPFWWFSNTNGQRIGIFCPKSQTKIPLSYQRHFYKNIFKIRLFFFGRREEGWGFLKLLWDRISDYFSSKKVFMKSNNYVAIFVFFFLPYKLVEFIRCSPLRTSILVYF